MPNVVAIINDDRARRQAEQYLQQLGMEDLRFATFKNHQEFTALYFRDIPEPDPNAPTEEPKKEEEAPADLKLFGDVHLLIFALDSIGEKSGPWIDKLRVSMKKFKHWSQASPTRLILLKYEDDSVSKLEVMHPFLDDLIYLPLDRLVFLQKLEIFLNLPQRIKPKFLFNQEVKQEIEISKITKLDRLSDVGLAIRNPIPLKRGLPGHFYLQMPGEKTRLEVRGKVFRSEPHPEFPGQYLVYFTYFGLPKSDLSMIRRSLSKAPRYQSLYNDDRSIFRFRSDDLFISTSASRQFGALVIDQDATQASNLAIQISKDMDRLKVTPESSYSLFLHKYFDAGAKTNKTPSRPTEPTDFYAYPLTLTVSANDFKCLSVDVSPPTNALLLGHPASELFATPEKWLNLISDKPSRLILEESIGLAAKDRPSDRLLIVQDIEDARRAINVKFTKSTAEHLVNVQITAATFGDLAIQYNTEEQTKDIDVLIVDSAFVADDTQTWIDNLRTRALQKGITKELTGLKFFIVAEVESRSSARWLGIPDVLGFFIKPVDTRQLGFLLSENLPNKNTVYQYENLGWAQPNLPVHVSKNVQLEALSEFGATLKSRQALVPGTMIYLRRSIYDNAPNQCLAARVYSCEQHSSEKEFFSVYTTYFGINDQFLKFARTWIRENYATQKGKE